MLPVRAQDRQRWALWRGGLHEHYERFTQIAAPPIPHACCSIDNI
jgi:hypothetical protein